MHHPGRLRLPSINRAFATATIYVRSERSGQRVMASLCRFIERRLKLKVNSTKSAVAKSSERHFLGFRLKRNPLDGTVSVRLSRRTKSRIDTVIKERTPRNWGKSLKQCISELNEYLQGWMGYFRICTEEERYMLEDIDGHIRRRLRVIQLKHWKRKRFIARHLIRLGGKPSKVWPSVYYGNRSWWRLSISQAVHQGLRNRYFADLGLYSLADNWKRWSSLKHVRVPRQLSLELG